MTIQPKVSIIIPVYNVEKYIEQCARSVFEQTYENLEIIFVNDCTPDKSMEIAKRVLEEFPNRKPQTKFINNSRNRGSAMTRQNGMDNSTGYYTIHCDSDDWMDTRMIELLVNKAQEEDADITICDFYVVKQKARLYKMNVPDEPIECMRKLLEGLMHAGLWSKLIKKSLYEDYQVKHTEGLNEREDLSVMYKLMYHARKIAYLPEPLYFYRNVPRPYTSVLPKTKLENCLQLMEQMDEFRSQHPTLPPEVTQAFIYQKAQIKMLVSLYGDRSELKRVNELLREATFKDAMTHPQSTLTHKINWIFETLRFTPGVLFIRLLAKTRAKLLIIRGRHTTCPMINEYKKER